HHLAASRVSGKVAVMYTKVTDEGFAAGQGFDNDVWYRQSSDNGVTWDAAVNITSYDRTEASYAAWLECHGVYDTDDDLHVIWNATPVPANPDMDADFGEFSCNLFHWSQANDRIVKVADANYGGEVNTQVCGFGDFNTMYIGMFSISECAGNMYVVYGQIHRDVSGWTDLADVGETLGLDCASGGDRGSIANWEIMMKVSTDLTGDLWNAPRSISNTYTADCDSAGFGGECGSEYKATVSRYGLDEAGLGLTFPSAAVVDLTPAGDPAYSGTSYLQMLYESDLFPGSWWSDSTHGPATFNAMKWVRLACVDPVTASLIEVSPARVSYPEHGPNGVETTVPVWVYNSGNTGMDVTSISVTETSGSQAGWLDVSATAITAIPYQDSATFNIRINKDGLIDNGTTGMEFLDGYVLLENTSANNDSVIINIHFLLADTLEAVAWDTVTTTDPWGTTKAQDDFVGLTMSNIGGVGHNGIGGVNMDFSVAGGECANNDDVYLYDGSVFLMQNPGDTVHLSSSLHNQDFASPRSFKPLVPTAGEEMSSGLTADYDSVYTGKFVNWDTSIVMEQTYYAPRGSDHNPVFVVRKTTVTATGAGAVANLSIGSMNDWDIPSEDGSDNKTGIIASSATLYVQGTDTLYVPEQGCQDDTARFGAEAFLGWYTGSEFAGNSCVNNESYYGVWADSFHGWWDDAGDNDYAEVWDSVAANSGLNANNGTFDQAVFTTYVHNYTLAAGETVTFYNAYVTIRDGSTDALANAVLEAKAWYNSVLRGCETVGACCQGGLCSILSASKCSEVGGVYSGDGTVCDPNPCGSCCVGERGNVQLEPNCNPADQGVDVGDLTNLIDHLFINFTPICCTDEADISPAITGNPPDGSVDVGDLTAMIDHLFINFPALPSCN
ncbi:MAG: hypothetical protein KKA42_06590, partial [candidate division Zixibacteria bacterium]|nr:hypothetical protein [candidate division Zixibacteria bacterium]